MRDVQIMKKPVAEARNELFEEPSVFNPVCHCDLVLVEFLWR